jgi:hypothetical protein
MQIAGRRCDVPMVRRGGRADPQSPVSAMATMETAAPSHGLAGYAVHRA